MIFYFVMIDKNTDSAYQSAIETRERKALLAIYSQH